MWVTLVRFRGEGRHRYCKGTDTAKPNSADWLIVLVVFDHQENCAYQSRETNALHLIRRDRVVGIGSSVFRRGTSALINRKQNCHLIQTRDCHIGFAWLAEKKHLLVEMRTPKNVLFRTRDIGVRYILTVKPYPSLY